jgi:hypothetical protein
MIMQEYREAMDVVETDSSRSWSGDVCMSWGYQIFNAIYQLTFSVL